MSSSSIQSFGDPTYFGQLVFHNYPEYCIQIDGNETKKGVGLIVAKVDKTKANEKQMWSWDSKDLTISPFITNNNLFFDNNKFAMDVPSGNVAKQLIIWEKTGEYMQQFRIVYDPTKAAFRISNLEKNATFYVNSTVCGKPNTSDSIMLSEEDYAKTTKEPCPGGKEKSSAWFRFVPRYSDQPVEQQYRDPDTDVLSTTIIKPKAETKTDVKKEDPSKVKNKEESKNNNENSENNNENSENNKKVGNNENIVVKEPWYKNTKILLAIGGGVTLIVAIVIVVVGMKSKGTKNEEVTMIDQHQQQQSGQ
jgi:hypothetical protein